MRNKSFGIVFVIASLLGLSSCGYHFSGVGGLIPEGAKTIAIPSFINDTNEPAVDVEVTRAVVDEFMADGRLRVVELEAADLALRARIVKYETTALSYTPNAFVQQYRARIAVEASLEDRRTGKVLWQEKDIEAVFIADYPVSLGDIRTTKIAKDAAIRKASQDIAWTLRSRVLEGF